MFLFRSDKNSGSYGNLFFDRLIKGKVKIDIFSVSIEIFRFYFYTNVFLSSPLGFIWLLSKSLNLIGCQGDKKGNFRKKNVKNLLHRNHKLDKADTLHACL